MARKKTKTADFGVSQREGHDSSYFYQRQLYAQSAAQTADQQKTAVPDSVRDSVVLGDSRQMKELPDNCIALAVTSPPYNVGKQYDDDLSLPDYLQLLKDVFAETLRVLEPGGRLAVNVANLGRKPYIPLHSYITHDLLELGYLMRGEIIWNKAASSGGSCAWGSWMSASNPTLRDVHEYILVFSKGAYKREGSKDNSTIERDEFLSFTKSVWEFPTESARKIGHPAPFPVELPRRLIELYTFVEDTVLDPFCGSGTTCVAAAAQGRHYVGYDIDANYVKLAEQRLLQEVRIRESRLF